MSEQKELTYILGAGASYQSIPVVKTFADRFDIFMQKMEVFSRGNSSYKQQDVYAVGTDLLKSFREHQSFDTYFKKLFHTNQETQIQIAKKYIHLYFLWEHTNSVESKQPEKIFWKESTVDKRYDALIAGLLRPEKGNCSVFTNTNFITWNYDLNLLSSIKNYYYPNENFADFISKIQTTDPFEWNIDNQIKVVNMNGYFYSSLFDNLKLISNGENRAFIDKKINNGYFSTANKDLDSERIKFAWEMDNNANKTIEIASTFINNSKNLVIVGYTFPLYNRLIDSAYLIARSFLGKNNSVFIQDPNADKIKDNFANILKPNYSYNRFVQPITDCDNFFVPSDIY